MRRKRSNSRLAFTLVELLVVIGIIAALIGILLPVLGGIQSRARDLQCQSNIRQCVALVLTYVSENNGQLPYGYYFNRSGGYPEGWGPAEVNGATVVTVWSIISRMGSKGYAGDDIYRNRDPELSAYGSATFLRCPEALQVQPHLCSYVGNIATFLTPFEDPYWGARRGGDPWARLIEKPTKITQCFPFTVLMWDTAVSPGTATCVGMIIGGDVDNQRIRSGAVHPQTRFLCANDPFAHFTPGNLGNNRPVLMNVSPDYPWYNIDPPANRTDELATFPYEGNLRFRHNRNTSCNVGFADGHVGSFTGKFTKDGKPVSHDALRRHFLVKWPSGAGIAPDPSLPY